MRVGLCLESPGDRSLERRSIEGNERWASDRAETRGGGRHGCKKVLSGE